MVAAILLSKAFTPASIRVEHVVPERFLLLEAGFNGFNVVFMNIYASTDGAERRLFFRNSQQQATEPQDFGLSFFRW